MLKFGGFPIRIQAVGVKFEAAVYKILCTEPNIFTSLLLYQRIPVQRVGPGLDPPQNITGHCLLVFEKAEGEKNMWWEHSLDSKVRANVIRLPRSFQLSQFCIQDHLLDQTARISASLFNFNLPLDFAAVWLQERVFQIPSERRSKLLHIPVAPTRECCIAIFESKIKAIIGNQGDMIGFEHVNHTVDPIAAAAKQSLLRLLP